MTKRGTPFRTLLDAGVPDSVGQVIAERGYEVIFHRDVLAEKTVDEVVCATALLNEAVLVAIDNDMKRLAQQYGVTPRGDRFKTLNIIRLCCQETQAAKRLEQAMGFIELEWRYSKGKAARRMWVDVAPHYIRTNR